MRQRICDLVDLTEGRIIKFEFARDGLIHGGWVGLIRGRIVAYENLCRHLPVPLDEDGDFLDGPGGFVVCRSHGAIYEPHSGLCIRGPCQGSSLIPISLEMRDGALWLGPEQQQT